MKLSTLNEMYAPSSGISTITNMPEDVIDIPFLENAGYTISSFT